APSDRDGAPTRRTRPRSDRSRTGRAAPRRWVGQQLGGRVREGVPSGIVPHAAATFPSRRDFSSRWIVPPDAIAHFLFRCVSRTIADAALELLFSVFFRIAAHVAQAPDKSRIAFGIARCGSSRSQASTNDSREIHALTANNPDR